MCYGSAPILQGLLTIELPRCSEDRQWHSHSAVVIRRRGQNFGIKDHVYIAWYPVMAGNLFCILFRSDIIDMFCWRAFTIFSQDRMQSNLVDQSQLI